MSRSERVRGVLAGVVALLLLASTAVPVHAEGHCTEMNPATPEQHGAPHHSSPNNTQGPGLDRYRDNWHAGAGIRRRG